MEPSFVTEEVGVDPLAKQDSIRAEDEILLVLASESVDSDQELAMRVLTFRSGLNRVMAEVVIEALLEKRIDSSPFWLS